MLVAGTEHGLYRLAGIDGDPTVERVADTGPVMRVRAPVYADGVLAATATGLYHSADGETWRDLGVPQEQVYSACVAPDGHVYAGTRPAHVYVSESAPETPADVLEWDELEGFLDLPSREEWRLPRHDDLAQVRDLHVPAAAPDRVVAGVEVGGVHVSEDGGGTWTERREGVDDDIHELLVDGPETFVAATGFGLFRTADAGRTWTRLDDGFDQRYFRSVAAVDGDVYAGGAIAHTATWEDEDAAPALFVCRDDDSLATVDHPRGDETVTGLTGIDGTLVAATHRGSVLVRRPAGWDMVADLPAPDGFAGGYTPLAWLDR